MTDHRTYLLCHLVSEVVLVWDVGFTLTINRLWKSDRRRSLTNSFGFLSSVPRAWFLKTTSSSHLKNISELHALRWTESTCLRFMLKSFGLRSGLPRAISNSRCSCSSAAFSASCTMLERSIISKRVINMPLLHAALLVLS